MGKASREKQEKRRQKEYARIAERTEKAQNDPVARESALAALNNPVARSTVAIASRSGVVRELRSASVEDQLGVMSYSANTPDKARKLRDAIIAKAPREMDKGIRKLQKEGKPMTVDALCAEVKTTPGFLKMCGQVGLSLEWFENLARKRMEALGL